MEEKIKEWFGPDPFFVELVTRHVRMYLKNFPNLSNDEASQLVLSELREIDSDREICNEFIKCLLKKTFDLDGAINIKGVNAKSIYENAKNDVDKYPIRVYNKLLSVKKQSNISSIEETNRVSKPLNEKTTSIEQNYNIDPKKNRPAFVYGPPRRNIANNLTDSQKEKLMKRQQEEMLRLQNKIKNEQERIASEKKNINTFNIETNHLGDRLVLELIEVVADANPIYCNSLKNYLVNINYLTREQVLGMLHIVAVFEDLKTEFLENLYNNNYDRSFVNVNGFTAKDIFAKNPKYSFLETYNDLAIMRIKMK